MQGPASASRRPGGRTGVASMFSRTFRLAHRWRGRAPFSTWAKGGLLGALSIPWRSHGRGRSRARRSPGQTAAGWSKRPAAAASDASGFVVRGDLAPPPAPGNRPCLNREGSLSIPRRTANGREGLSSPPPSVPAAAAVTIRLTRTRLVTDTATVTAISGVLRILLDLGPQPLHVYVDQPGSATCRYPQPARQHLTGKDLARLAASATSRSNSSGVRLRVSPARFTEWPATSITMSPI